MKTSESLQQHVLGHRKNSIKTPPPRKKTKVAFISSSVVEDMQKSRLERNIFHANVNFDEGFDCVESKDYFCYASMNLGRQYLVLKANPINEDQIKKS